MISKYLRDFPYIRNWSKHLLNVSLFHAIEFDSREISFAGMSDEFEFFSLNEQKLEIGGRESSISTRLTKQYTRREVTHDTIG